MERAVFFECENTLVDCGAVTQRAWQTLAEEWLAEPPPRVALQALHGRRPQDALPGFLPHWFPHREVEETLTTYANHYFRAARDIGLRQMPGARDLLGALRDRGIPFACVSANTLDLTLFHLHEAGLLSAFETCVAGDEVDHGPPSGDIVTAAAGRLGVPAASCVVVSACPLGIQAAATAGARAIGMVGAFTAADLAAAQNIVGSSAELSTVLSQPPRDTP